MSREFRPNRKAFFTSFVVTFAVLGGVWLLGKTNPVVKTSYAPRWETHGKYYLDKGCADCHTPFRPVSDDSCFTCHADYKTDFDINSVSIYEADWSADVDIPAQIQRKTARVKHAHLMYHDLGEIRAMTCASCHPEHIPPPPPDGWDFVHRHGDMLPDSVNLNNCAQCHSPAQAPPIEVHAEYLAGAGRDCSVCHRSSIAWSVEVINRPLDGAAQPTRPAPTPSQIDVPRKSIREGIF